MTCTCGHTQEDHRPMPIGKRYAFQDQAPATLVCWAISDIEGKGGYFVRRNYCPCMEYHVKQ